MTAQCSLCDPGACHDDACPHALPRKVMIRTRGLLRGHDTISVQDYERHAPIREMIARSNQWQFNDYVQAWVDISSDDVRHVPFGEGKR